jgi:hypothetical protein
LIGAFGTGVMIMTKGGKKMSVAVIEAKEDTSCKEVLSHLYDDILKIYEDSTYISEQFGVNRCLETVEKYIELEGTNDEA